MRTRRAFQEIAAVPMTAMMRQRLEAAANAVFIIVALVLTAVVVRTHFAESTDPSLREGELLPPIPDYSWASQSRTLVLALKEGCTFCEASAPFYRRLSEMARRGEISARLLAVFPDSGIAVQNFLARADLSIDHRAGVAFAELKVTAAPTLILVSSTGRVLHVWRGQLSPQAEEHVVELVGTPSPREGRRGSQNGATRGSTEAGPQPRVLRVSVLTP
jgi:thiol-disulfide isomerase/thioredoxin